MKFIETNRKKHGSLFDKISAGIKEIVDDSKERYIIDSLSEGLSNRLIFEKFNGFHWPLWLEYTTNPSSDNCRAFPNPLLLNTSFREWQVFTNYLSSGEIKIDRAGMITGPSSSEWSLEFWVCNDGEMLRPQNDPCNVKLSRNSRTGEITAVWDTENFTLTERIAGSRSSVDEALISVELNVRRGGKSGCMLAVVRPYNNRKLGSVNSIDVDKSAGLVSVNNKLLLGFDTPPDGILSGSGLHGDINLSSEPGDGQVKCGHGMATTALKYSSATGRRVFNFRISLDDKSDLPVLKMNYTNLFKEFGLFTEMRLSEGIKADHTDAGFTDLFLQSRLSILNITGRDVEGDTVEDYRRLYFFIYAFCRTGALDSGESVVVVG